MKPEYKYHIYVNKNQYMKTNDYRRFDEKYIEFRDDEGLLIRIPDTSVFLIEKHD